MQEQLNRAMAGMTELAAPGDTPSLEEVRDKIEGRYARALGEAELQSTSVEARMLQVERASIDAEGAARLESIREGLGLPSPSATPCGRTLEEGADRRVLSWGRALDRQLAGSEDPIRTSLHPVTIAKG